MARAGFTELSRSAAYGAVAPFYLLQIEFNEGNYRYVVTTGGSLIDRAAGERRTELERIVAEGWFHLGDYGRTEEFLDAYRRSGGEMGRNENYLLGYSLYRQARYDEARPCLQQVCGADDALTQNASYHLADCYLRGGDKRRAMQSFAMAANEAFDAAIAEDALFNYGKLQYELGGGLFNEAIHVLNRYIAQYPTSERAVQARELLIAAYYNSRNYEAAYTALKHYPSPDGNLRAALQKIAYFRGLEAYSRGDLDGAAQSLSESAAINVSPKYGALARFWLGEIAFARGDYAEAERRYKEYLHRAPRTEDEYAKAHYNLGYCYFDRGDMSNAYASFARFNQLYSAADRYKADALNREADARYSLRQFSAALATYEKGGGRRHEREILRRFPACRDAGHSRPRAAEDRGTPTNHRRRPGRLRRRRHLRTGTHLHRVGALRRRCEGVVEVRRGESPFALLHAGALRSGIGLPQSGSAGTVAPLLRARRRVGARFGHGARRLAGHPRDLRGRRQCRRLLRLRREGRRGV